MNSTVLSSLASANTDASAEVINALLGLGVVACVVAFVLVILGIVAYFVTIGTLANIAADKGGRIGRGKAWFIGLFMTPLVLAVVVAADYKRS